MPKETVLPLDEICRSEEEDLGTGLGPIRVPKPAAGILGELEEDEGKAPFPLGLGEDVGEELC